MLCYSTAIDFNPLPPHGGRRNFHAPNGLIENISIHSLRMEGDCVILWNTHRKNYFNPLPPHGGRLQYDRRFSSVFLFQSTPSAWRETPPSRSIFSDPVFQSTPSAWRETAFGYGFKIQLFHFNPLPPHGGRPSRSESDRSDFTFQSTPSAWRETTHQ